MISTNLIAIYDFEFFPYALGDVLTWNIRSAMRCEELNKTAVDIYICLDKKHPSNIYQGDLVNHDNFELFFSELYGAFGTNPKLGNIFIFRKRECLLKQLQSIAKKDMGNIQARNDYYNMLKINAPEKPIIKFFKKIKSKLNHYFRYIAKNNNDKILSKEATLINYFIKYIHSHKCINQFAAEKGFIPYLKPSVGCTPDIDEIIECKFKGKKIVAFHLRLRRLDMGYGGNHTYPRDSNFLEWYDFLNKANAKYPHIQFIALGRIQEKPLEILRLPNVTSLRLYGMGLGHELTLMLRSDLFIGTSSGFAALANFSSLPYFITRMNQGSCEAYAIPNGTEKLPFATDRQKLIYEEETSELLMNLLEKGLDLKDTNVSINPTETKSNDINVTKWINSHANPVNSARTTCRFYNDEKYRHEETSYLLLPSLEKVRDAILKQDISTAEKLLIQLKYNFPDLCSFFQPYLILENCLADLKKIEEESIEKIKKQIGKINFTGVIQ